MAIKIVQVTLNGQTYDATYDSASGKYKVTLTAPSTTSYNRDGHYYPLTVKATDTAGNITTKDDKDSTLGSSLRLRVKETVKPAISITYPTAGAAIINNRPAFSWKVTDAGAGVNPDTVGITIDSGVQITGSAITKTAISGGYQCTYTPSTALSDGSHTAKFDVSDYDDNAATQSSVTFKIDTVPPTLNVTAPTDKLVTKNTACPVTGNTNDITSSPVSLKVNGTTATVNADGTFSTTVNLVEGSNTITIVATDSAGKSTTVTRQVTLDTKAPVIKSASLSKSTCTTGESITILIEVED